MFYVFVALLVAVAMQTAAIVALWVRSSRRAHAEREIRDSEERFRHALDQAPVILWTARPDASLDYFNRTCIEFTGMPTDKLRNDGWLDAIHPEDRDSLIGVYMPAMESRTPFVAEYRAHRADGSCRWLLTTGVPRFASDGSYAGYVGCDIDITERKQAQEAARRSRTALEQSYREIQQLAGRLIEAQDAERARVARDLHDDVSQQLAGLSIALSSLKRRMDGQGVSEDLLADLGTLQQRTTALAQSVRHVSHDLHPTVLRHAGLVTALTSYCAELRRSHGTALTCTAQGDFASIAPEIALCLYRIAQEALRNVIAHARAGRADIRLLRTADNVEITIADDGRGFDVVHSLEQGKGLGLVSITERARLVGGTVDIVAEPNKGTLVRARIPARVTAGPGIAGERRELSLS